MSFEDSMYKYKSDLVRNLIDFGEGKRVNRFLKEVDANLDEFKFFYTEGVLSRQEEINALNDQITYLRSQIDHLKGENRSSKIINLIKEYRKKVFK